MTDLPTAAVRCTAVGRTRTFTWTSNDDRPNKPPRPPMFPLINPESRDKRRDWAIGVAILVALTAAVLGMVALDPGDDTPQPPTHSTSG